MNFDMQVLGSLDGPSNKAGTDATVTTNLIRPYPGANGVPFLYKPKPPSAQFGEAFSHITSLIYSNGDTAHVLTIMRPKNYGWLVTALAAAGTALVPNDDPGVYSTNYRYGSPLSTGTAVVADNPIAASDWVAIQLNDGTFHLSKIASGTYGGANLVLTTAVPNVTGGGAAVGNAVYFFGVPGDKDPASGQTDPAYTAAASAVSTWSEGYSGVVAALHGGDPLVFYDPGTTHLGTLVSINGFYAKV